MGFRVDYRNQMAIAEVGGKKCRFRSQLEWRFARYLELLKCSGQISEWQYEAAQFCFPDDKWLVDFVVQLPGGEIEYYECKGYFDARSRRKIRLLSKYYPEIQINFVFAKKSDAKRLSKRARAACKRICVFGTRGLVDIKP